MESLLIGLDGSCVAMMAETPQTLDPTASSETSLGRRLNQHPR